MSNCVQPTQEFCKPQKGTIIRIAIAPGTTISLFGLFELTSPSGICLLVNLPFLARRCGRDSESLLDALRNSGCKVEYVNE